jgi:hypothetical protein
MAGLRSYDAVLAATLNCKRKPCPYCTSAAPILLTASLLISRARVSSSNSLIPLHPIQSFSQSINQSNPSPYLQLVLGLLEQVLDHFSSITQPLSSCLDVSLRASCFSIDPDLTPCRRQRRQRTRQGRCQAPPKDFARQHPGHHEARHPSSCSPWWCQAYLCQ